MRRFVPRALLAAVFAVSATACAGGGAGVDPTGDFGGRYLVLVPDLQGPSGPQVANELRRLITEMPTHAAINNSAVQAAMAQYEVAELDEITARQLAPLIQAQLVSWGSVTQGGPGYQANVDFIDARSGDEITVEAAAATPAELAAEIFADFSQSMEGIAQAAYCNDYLSSNQYDRALETCDAALQIVPTSSAALYGRATALLNLERYQEALDGYNRLLEMDPTHQDALLGAGLAASQLDMSDQAMAYYNRYLEVNPGNIDVRMAVANDVAQTGDYVSAFGILETGIADNQDNTDFQEYLFSIATAAGQRAYEQGDSANAQRIFNAAYNAYQAAFADAEEIPVAALRNAVAVTTRLGRTDDAIRLAQEGTQRSPDDAQMWSVYATALRDAGRDEQAIEALSRIIQIDPEFENAYIRRGQAYLEAGQRQQALADFERAAAAGDRETVARLLYNSGATAFQADNFAEAAAGLAAAHPYAEGELRSDISFLWAFSLFRQGEAIARANTQGSAAEARRAMEIFERALPLAQSSSNAQAAQVVSALQQYMENQRAIIQAGSR